MKITKLKTLLAISLLALGSTAARASTAYGSINSFDTVNDTGHECHGFEIEIEDIHSPGSLLRARPADATGWVLQESADFVTWLDSSRPITTSGAQ